MSNKKCILGTGNIALDIISQREYPEGFDPTKKRNPFKDNLIVDSEGEHTLSITSNISGSALQCPVLTVNKNAKLELLSRNSQEGMFALSCPLITVKGGTLLADVTTAFLAIETTQLNLNGSWLEKPKGGIVDAEKLCVCFGDGTPAKRVRITPEK